MNLRSVLVLGRHVLWLTATFVVMAALVRIRLDVVDLRERLDQSGRHLEEAEIMRGRLAAELDARRRASNMQAAAGRLGLRAPERVIDVPLEGAQ